MPRRANLTDLIGERKERTSSPARPEAQSGPKYLRLDTKDVRFWPGQRTDLEMLVQELNRQRRRQGERITVNTLVRLAAAWIVEHGDQLQGITEEELAESLGLKNYPPEPLK